MGALSAAHVTRLRPNFLICSERSGSNLIRSILNAHPALYAPDPIHLGAFWERIAEFGDLGDDRRWRALLGAIVEFLSTWKGTLHPALVLDVERLDAEIERREFVAIYEHIYARGLALSGKAELFIKENHTAQRAPLLLAAFPTARFVYQTRDPRDFLASCKQMPSYKYGSAAAALAVWRADQRAALALAEQLPPTRVSSGRYEDLLTAPEAYLRRVCTFLGLPYADQMLEFYKTEDARRAAAHDAWRNLGQPLIRTNSGRFGERLTRAEIDLVEGQVGALMRRLGYIPHGPGVDDPDALASFGEHPHRLRVADRSGSAVVHRVIDRWVA